MTSDLIYVFQECVAAMMCPAKNVEFAFKNQNTVWKFVHDNERGDLALVMNAWPKEWMDFCPGLRCNNPNCCKQELGKCGVWGCVACPKGARHVCKTCNQFANHRACHCSAILCNNPNCCKQEYGKCGTWGCVICRENEVHLCTCCHEHVKHRARHCPKQQTQSLCASFGQMSILTSVETLKDKIPNMSVGGIPLSVTKVGAMLLRQVNGGIFVLCGKRADWLPNGDKISSPGGDIEGREQPIDAVIRETMEESGFGGDIFDCFHIAGNTAVCVGIWDGKQPKLATHIHEVKKFSDNDIPKSEWLVAGNEHRWVALDWLVGQGNNKNFVSYFINNCKTLKNKLDTK